MLSELQNPRPQIICNIWVIIFLKHIDITVFMWKCLLIQIIERKPELAKLEALDCGKPYDEAAWDMVYDTPYRSLHYFFPASHYDPFAIPLIRMMLLGALSTLRIRQKPWTKGKIPQSLFLWRLSSAIFGESLSELLGLSLLGIFIFLPSQSFFLLVCEQNIQWWVIQLHLS